MSINNVQIRSEVLDMLKQGLKCHNHNMYRLNLNGIEWQLDREGIDFVVEKLQTNSTLNDFWWSYCGELEASEVRISSSFQCCALSSQSFYY